jgi:hypothetical protein
MLYVCYMYMSVICCYMLYVGYMLYVCYMSNSRPLLLYIYVCHVLYSVRGVGSGSRYVDAWRANGLYDEDWGLQVPMTLEHVFTREIA